MKKRKSRSLPFKFRTVFGIILIIAIVVYFGFISISIFRSRVGDISLSGLEIKVNSNSDIFLDNQKLGQVNSNESFISTKIEPGEKRIKILKTSDNTISYERNIIFEKGTSVNINWNFGVTSDTSYGITKYFVKKIENTNKIRIISSIQSSNISIDNNPSNLGVIPADGLDHKITISKVGYLSQDAHAQLANLQTQREDISQSDKEKYDGYDLVIEISLYQIPFE